MHVILCRSKQMASCLEFEEFCIAVHSSCGIYMALRYSIDNVLEVFSKYYLIWLSG